MQGSALSWSPEHESKRVGRVIRILIADDSTAVQDGVAALLRGVEDFDVVGTAKDGVEALRQASVLRPDVVIMDSQMPRMNGVDCTRRIKQTLSNVGVLFFTVYTDCIEAGRDAGADGYLLKDCEPEELISMSRKIAENMRTSRELHIPPLDATPLDEIW